LGSFSILDSKFELKISCEQFDNLKIFWNSLGNVCKTIAKFQNTQNIFKTFWAHYQISIENYQNILVTFQIFLIFLNIGTNFQKFLKNIRIILFIFSKVAKFICHIFKSVWSHFQKFC
jgi:hypothetical protein